MFRNNKAFTLIELMVVIVIIGILATLAIPKFNEASVKAKVSEAPTVLSSFDNAQLAYLAETNALGSIDDLAIMSPSDIVSKYYTFGESANGKLYGTAAAAGMGDVNGADIWTEIGPDGSLTHSADAAFTVYLPNWCKTSS